MAGDAAASLLRARAARGGLSRGRALDLNPDKRGLKEKSERDWDRPMDHLAP